MTRYGWTETQACHSYGSAEREGAQEPCGHVMTPIERMARAICKADIESSDLPFSLDFAKMVDEIWHEYADQARAALTAL